MIPTSYLRDVAQYTSDRVAKVVLNDTYEITQFDSKAVADNELAIRYLVPFGSVAAITKVELRDAADNVISTNAVYVPITTDHLMLQTIEVKEV